MYFRGKWKSRNPAETGTGNGNGKREWDQITFSESNRLASLSLRLSLHSRKGWEREQIASLKTIDSLLGAFSHPYVKGVVKESISSVS